jgi:hypothetical protein
MSARKPIALAAVLLGLLLAPQAATAATPAAAWSVQSLAEPTNFKPGEESGLDLYEVFLTNSGGDVTNGTDDITITDTLPKGIGVKSVELWVGRPEVNVAAAACEPPQTVAEVTTLTCTVDESLTAKEPARLFPQEQMRLLIRTEVPPTAAGPLFNRVEVEGGGAEAAAIEGENEASAEEAPAGFQEFHAKLVGADGLPVTQADGHPYAYVTSFGVNTELTPPSSNFPFRPAEGDLKDIEVRLPPGLVGNPMAIQRCTAKQFNTIRSVAIPGVGSGISQNECPDASAVGVLAIQQLEGAGGLSFAAIYNLVPPKGMPAQFGLQIIGLPIYINAKLRSESDYGITGYLTNLSEAKRVTASTVTLWGTPADPEHDRLRGRCVVLPGGCDAEEPTVRPFFRLPSSCQSPLLIDFSFTTWAQPATGAAASEESPAPAGCALPDFSPTIQSRPTTNVADSPTGLHFNLHIPQKSQEDPNGTGEADLRDATVTLPRGLAVNPASAGGLGACSSAQIGLITPLGQLPPHFSEAPQSCPNAAKVGTATAITPLLDHPIEGSVYLAKQEDNPFKSLIAIYLVFEDPQSGVVIKLAGEVKPNPVTGQLSTTFLDNPQAPVEDFELDFFEGARAPLRTPAACGAYTTTSALTPWTAPEGASAFPTDSFQIAAGPGGGCPSGALAAKLAAGLQSPTAGAYSPFSLRLTREDATQEFAGLSASPPLGLSAKLKGVPYCPEAGIAQAASRTRPGDGALEASSSSCPPASQIGTTTAGAGAGPSPFYASGKVFFAGPYKGAPLSMVAIVPAIAGPFDLGVVVDRVALRVNPETAQVTAVADPLPTILAGIPLDVRDLRVNLDRAAFTLAPTSCDPKSVSAAVQGVNGASATVSDRFQLGGCGTLRFKPSLSLKLNGGTRRGAHPAFKAVVSYPSGSTYANTASAQVALPHSEFLEQSHIRTICTRVQFAASACPKGSIYGKARAITPLLEQPLEGPVYLRSSSNPLPDLVLSLKGQIDVVAVGRIDSHNGGIRTTFETVPDAPLSKVVLEMRGGKKGLLVNSRNICKHVNRATAKFTGQNGRRYDFRPVLKDSCEGGGKGSGGGGKKSGAQKRLR